MKPMQHLIEYSHSVKSTLGENAMLRSVFKIVLFFSRFDWLVDYYVMICSLRNIYESAFATFFNYVMPSGLKLRHSFQHYNIILLRHVINYVIVSLIKN